MSNKLKCPTSFLQSVPLLGCTTRVGHFWDTNLSGNGFSMSCDVWGEGMKKTSETSFQRVCLDFVRLWLWTLSGKRDSNSRPQPWQGCALPTELFPQLHGFVRRRTSPFRECKYKRLFGFEQTFPAKNFAFASIFGCRPPSAHRAVPQSVPQQALRVPQPEIPCPEHPPLSRKYQPGAGAIRQSHFPPQCRKATTGAQTHSFALLHNPAVR